MNDKMLTSIAWVIGVAVLATLIFALVDGLHWLVQRATALLVRMQHPRRHPLRLPTP